MRVKGWIRRTAVIILIDSRSTHNFLSPHIARKAGLMVQHGPCIEVAVANGERMSCQGRCDEVFVRIQELPITADFFWLKLGGCDAVLGAQWLEKLGPITWDFANLTMSFQQDQRSYCLKGEKRPAVGLLPTQKPNKAFNQISCCYLLKVCSMHGEEKDPVPTEVTQLIRAYEGIFM